MNAPAKQDGFHALDFLVGGSEMGERIRSHRWSGTPLGDPTTWPQSLRSAVSMCINARAVSAIYWGPEFRLIYNDGYKPFLDGRHPAALGRPMAELWPRLWQTLKASAQGVLDTGESFVAENQRLLMDRGDGLEETFWYYSFAPIRGESGAVDGIFLTALDTSGQAIAERSLEAERERLRDLFRQAPSFMTVLRGPEHIYELTNAAYLQLIGHRDVLGKPVRELLEDLGYVTTWASNGGEALKLLAEPDSFDVVFSDVVMPGMSGVELGQEIRRLYPGPACPSCSPRATPMCSPRTAGTASSSCTSPMPPRSCRASCDGRPAGRGRANVDRAELPSPAHA